MARIIAEQPYPPGRNGRWRIEPKYALTIIGWIMTVALAWGAINTRVAIIETRLEEGTQRQKRMEDKLDRLLERRP